MVDLTGVRIFTKDELAKRKKEVPVDRRKKMDKPTAPYGSKRKNNILKPPRVRLRKTFCISITPGTAMYLKHISGTEFSLSRGIDIAADAAHRFFTGGQPLNLDYAEGVSTPKLSKNRKLAKKKNGKTEPIPHLEENFPQ